MPASRGALSKLYLIKLKLQLVLFMYLQYGMLNVHYIILPWLLPYFYVKQKNSVFCKNLKWPRKLHVHRQVSIQNFPVFFFWKFTNKTGKSTNLLLPQCSFKMFEDEMFASTDRSWTTTKTEVISRKMSYNCYFHVMYIINMAKKI